MRELPVLILKQDKHSHQPPWVPTASSQLSQFWGKQCFLSSRLGRHKRCLKAVVYLFFRPSCSISIKRLPSLWSAKRPPPPPSEQQGLYTRLNWKKEKGKKKKPLHIWYCFSCPRHTDWEGKDVGKGGFDCVNGITCSLLALVMQSRFGLGFCEREDKQFFSIIFHSINYKHADLICGGNKWEMFWVF